MRRFRGEDDEAGLALLPYLVIILVAASLPVAIPVAQDISDVMAGKWNPKEQQAPAPTRADLPFIGPGKPDDKVKADCVEKVADRVGLYWTDKGWRTGAIDEPSLSGNPARVRAEIAFFRRRMEAYVGARSKEWESCLKDGPSVSSGPTPSIDLAPDVAGTYTVQFQGTTSSYCRDFTLPTQIRVTGGASEISISTTTDQLTGTIDRGYSFSANGVRQVGGGLGIRMLGRFERDGTDTLIRNGSLVFNAEEECTFDFTGKRSGG